jgi:hypothetical protein
MATLSKRRRNSVISISSGEDSPRSPGGSVISISSDDGGLRPTREDVWPGAPPKRLRHLPAQ